VQPEPETPRPQQQIATNLEQIPTVPRAPIDFAVIPNTLPSPSSTIGTIRPEDFRVAPRDTSSATGPAGPEPGQPFAEFMVEKAVVALEGNPPPRYPQFLAAAGVQGDVFVQFVVDTTGRVEPSSINFTRSSHRLFEGSVRDVLLRSRYAPAEFGGRRVRQLVEQAFSFNLKR
jgi:protein TonB